MRRPHVFERSAPRSGRTVSLEPINQAATARTVAAQLAPMIEKVDGAGLSMLAYLLELARIEAEKVFAQGAADQPRA